MAQVLNFQRRFARQVGWTQDELAEFYRVESALAQAGLHLETEQGVTDEGDPWFIFCRHDTGEIFIHFARIDGEFIIDGFGYENVARGRDFAALVRELISSELFAVAKARPKNGNVFLHPAALLIMLVGTAFLHSSEAKAAETHEKAEPRRVGGFAHLLGSSASELLPSDLDAVQAAALVAGAVLASEPQALSIAPPPPPAPSGATSQINGGELGVFLQAPSLQSAPVRAVHDAAVALADPATGISAEHFATPTKYLVPDVLVADTSINVTPIEPLRVSLVSAPVASAALLSAPITFDSVFLPASAPAALPADEAGALLQGLTTQDHPVITLNGSLPDEVIGLMKTGLHVVADHPLTGITAPAAITAPPATPDQGATAASAQVAPPTPAPAPAAQTPFHDPGVDLAIAQFIANVPHWEVIVSGRDLIVYDAAIFTPHAAEALDGITFTLPDGSAVSLVGTAQELLFAHSVH